MTGSQAAFEDVYSDLAIAIRQYEKETNQGQSAQNIIAWQTKISSELGTTYSWMPPFKKRKIGYGMNLAFGSGVFTGSLAGHFGQTFNFSYGFDFAYKKSHFFINGTIAGDRVKSEYREEGTWHKDQKASVTLIDICYGQPLTDNARVKLVPFAGLGVIELTGDNKDNPDVGLRLVNYNLFAGICTDYKIRTRVNLSGSQFFQTSEITQTSIRARLYVARVHYFGNLQGISINLTIGICGLGNLIDLQRF